VEIVVLKGVGMNGIDCKGNPTGLKFGWIPKLNAWLGRIREPSHPGDALNELVELNVTLAINFGKGVNIYI